MLDRIEYAAHADLEFFDGYWHQGRCGGEPREGYDVVVSWPGDDIHYVGTVKQKYVYVVAAAPEMLAALEHALRDHTWLDRNMNAVAALVQRARRNGETK